MAGVNSILSGVYSSVGVVRAGTAAHSQPSPVLRPAQEDQDVFQAGQYWRNRAEARSASLVGDSCRCGACILCAARVYEDQEANLSLGEDSDQGEGNTALSAGNGVVQRDSAEKSEEQSAVEPEGAPQSAALEQKGSDGAPLSRAELAQLAELKKVDAAVRAHEQAHLSAAGGLAKGGASFSYQKGPDGRNYAVGGEVQIDTSTEATPEETVVKMTRVRAAALAPANPSPQDRKVAAAASATMTEARLEVRAEKSEMQEQEGEESVRRVAESAEDEASDSSYTGLGEKKTVYAQVSSSAYRSAAQGTGAFHVTA